MGKPYKLTGFAYWLKRNAFRLESTHLKIFHYFWQQEFRRDEEIRNLFFNIIMS